MFIWSGDILLLYALLGMLLPLFLKLSDKKLLWLSAVFIVFPVVVDVLTVIGGINLSEAVVRWQQYYCGLYGITDDNFGIWLRDADSYDDVFRFLIQGVFVRSVRVIGIDLAYAGLQQKIESIKKEFIKYKF